MADNGSSNVASVAIVIIVLAALAVAYYVFQRNGGLKADTSEPTKVEVSLPSVEVKKE